MQVAVCTIKLYLPGNVSLKGKRSLIKPLIIRLRREFNVSVAEVGDNDLWQTATIALAAVSNDSAYLHGLLQKAVNWLQDNSRDVQLIDYNIEIW